jgi:ABC-type multidrug transport system fused ATPase/permease subunit
MSEYIRLEKEDMKPTKNKNKQKLPERGEIIFDNVSFAYGDGLPLVLTNLTFRINPKEKVGIIGRTGCGKSTILQAILRMAEPNGYIMIDDINIKDLSLSDLRSRISIITVSLQTILKSMTIHLLNFLTARCKVIHCYLTIQFRSFQ